MENRKIKRIFRDSFKNSSKVAIMILKIFIPVSLLVTILKQYGIIDYIAPVFEPLTIILGLPADSGIVLITGFMNMFAGIGSMAAFSFTARQLTIIAIVIGLSHALFVETAVLMKLGMARLRIAFFRMFIAIITGMIMNLILPENVSGVVLNPYMNVVVFSWLTTIKGIILTSVQMFVVLFAVTFGYNLVALWKYSGKLKSRIKFFPSSIGISERSFAPWFIGLIIGISYGAGLLFQISEKKKLPHKDLCLTTIFLIFCHAIIEDTLLFVVIGANIWWIIVTRIVLAFVIVKILSIKDLYKKLLWIGLPKEK